MRAQEHWNKAARLEASRAKAMKPEEDYEMIIWSCIHGGAQLANVVLHRRGVTAENEDQIHTDVPVLERQLPEEVAQFLGVLKSIEKLGPRFVRGIEPYDPAAIQACLQAYEKLKALAKLSLQ